MQFGMFTDFHVRKGGSQAEAFDESFDQVNAAEKLGMDSVWLAEIHFRPDRSALASPLIVASAIAARTQRMRIGLAVQVLPLTNPLRTAEEAATVDHISQGRFDFGIGRSDFTQYYQGYNVSYSESRGRFYEAWDVIMKAWQQETFSHEGEFYSYEDVTVVPKPYQRPTPPVRVAVYSEDSFPMMGRKGCPIFVPATMEMDLLQHRISLYREAWHEAGHAGPPDVMFRTSTYVAETTEKARSEPETSAMDAMRYATERFTDLSVSQETIERISKMGGTSYEEVLAKRVMYGTPEEIVDRIHQYSEKLGISGLVMDMNYGGAIPYDRVLNSIRLFAEHVIPAFR